ncbi:ATP-dependent DNA ligase [Polychaeton citri CBS 116435]|uniref:DNA ligase n=1 Tax=Polychaeton citri CBS 116435 TaxID=1314669 RepID=A0A9P4QA79_9PEZI|nr:ATP-dependent DNA ligase [Polychaeton citri CBS 116435]
MAPKQSTLGKFFANPNGTKPAPQQSKLGFSSRTQPKVKSEIEQEAKPTTKESAHANWEDKNDDEDAEINGSTQIKQEKPADEIDASADGGNKSPSKKRATSSSPADEEDETAEMPPAKRQRQRSGSAKAKKATIPQTDESNDIREDASEQDQDEDDEPVKPHRRAKRDGAGHQQHKKEQATSSPTELQKSSPRKQAQKVDAVSSKPKPSPETTEEMDEQESASVTSETEASDEEDQKPKLTVKAREKVQSTLKSTDRPAYPDWKPNEPVPYAALCTTFSKIEMTTKRLEILALTAVFLQQVLRLTPNDVLPTVLLMQGKLAADFEGVELGIGESLIMKAIGETTGRNLKIIKEDQARIGDLGLVAAKSRQNQPTMFKPKPLTVRSVHEGLMKIATVEGQGSQGRKVDGIKKLLSAADTSLPKGQSIDITQNKGGPSEAKFIIRALEGKMRLGLADKSLQVALAHAIVAHDVSKDGGRTPSEADIKKGEELFKSVYNELPSYEAIVPALLQGGIWKLRDACKLRPGVPLKPMLAKPTKSIGEVLDRFEGKDFTCEYKYDGERAQIHFVDHNADEDFAAAIAPLAGKSERGISNIFSRNSEDLSKKYPDILQKLPTWVKKTTKSFVLDCETVAWDVETKHVLPFQQLMTRKRKDVKADDVKVKVCVFAFDILFLNGEALVNKPFRERRDLLYSAFEEVEGEFSFAKFGNSREIDEIQVLLEESIKASCEGLMVKMLDGVESHYEPSRRSQNWLKVKKDYLSGAGDSLDLVVLGAYYGKGKRTSVYGAFQLACFNPSTEMYETVCNIGTGFSEVVLQELYDTLSPIVIDRPKPFYNHSEGKNDQPDVWFEPRFVWEVKTADLTLSPRYRAAAAEVGDGSHKGVSLRFPRFIRIRDDKKPDAATTSRQVAEMYRAQEHVGKDKKPGVDDDFEY